MRVLGAWFAAAVVSAVVAVTAFGWPSAGAWLEPGLRGGIVVALVVLVLVHLFVERTSAPNGDRSGLPVSLRSPPWFCGLVGATIVAGAVLSAILVVPFRAGGVIGMNVNDAGAACLMLAPCFSLGFLCGRWWACAGGVPVLVVGLFGIVYEGGRWTSALDWSVTVGALAAVGALTRLLANEPEPRRTSTLAIGIAAGLALFLVGGLIVEA